VFGLRSHQVFVYGLGSFFAGTHGFYYGSSSSYDIPPGKNTDLAGLTGSFISDDIAAAVQVKPGSQRPR
jgi:hypothetical protein